jgi:hypothetical protein
MMLQLKDARTLLDNDYLPVEAGHGPASDGMYHVAASTYMPGCSAEMIDWWFGFIHNTEQYKLWHVRRSLSFDCTRVTPLLGERRLVDCYGCDEALRYADDFVQPRDHVFSDWEGPRENKSEYIGGHHLVHEYIGGEMCKLKISFKDPGNYFGPDWKQDFEAKGYGTAVCGRVGMWDEEKGTVLYTGHLIHLIKDEPNACRMRSRFWLGDVEGVAEAQGTKVPEAMRGGLMKHCIEEMAILASQLPELYRRHRRQGPSL